MANDTFSACLGFVLGQEGGYADHPSDPGGATNKGITRKTLARWRGVSPWWTLPKLAVRDISRREVEAIYRRLYWNRCNASGLPAGVDLAVFDYAVNSGPLRSINSLQALLGVRADGWIGPITLKAAKKADAEALLKALCHQRLGFLNHLKTFPIFGRGWTQRVAAVQAAALVMLGKSAQSVSKPRKTGMNMLSGYKTYIVGILMLLTGVAQLAGVQVPGFADQNAMQLVMEGFAVVFMRKGLKTEIGNS